jgi:hypothetical protein
VVLVDSSRELFKELVSGAMATLIASRQGTIVVEKLAAADPVATWTDDDQILSIDVIETILKTYAGVRLGYKLPQVTEDREVLSIEELVVPIGTTVHDLLKYENPVYNISAVMAIGASGVHVSDYLSTSTGIVLTTVAQGAGVARILVTGKMISLVTQEAFDDVPNVLEVQNSYIQTSVYAQEFKAALEQLISVHLPEMELTIRGNPNILLGQTVQVNSDRYGVAYTGIVKRMVYTYVGSLSCRATLMNAEGF